MKFRDWLNEKKWSGAVKTKWKPPEGLFTKSAPAIAKGLISASSGLKQAMSRLNFYVNRAGKNLDAKERKKFDRVKELLRKNYGA